MKNKFETWLNNNAPGGQALKGKLLALGAAGIATALVGLSVVLMAGLDLPAGELPAEARVPATAPVQAGTPGAGQTVRYAEALPTVTVVGRREPGDKAALPVTSNTAALPARPASGDGATVGMTAAGDNLRQ
jgi:hypothetical protein